MQVVGRPYRWAIYALLLLVLAAGIFLFSALSSSTRQIRSATEPLIKNNIPTLRHAASFDSALLRYQVALNSFVLAAADNSHPATPENQAQAQLVQGFELLRRDLSDGMQLQALTNNYQAILNIGPALEKLVAASASAADGARQDSATRDGLRALLAELNLRTSNVHELLDQITQNLDISRNEVGASIDSGFDRISLLIKLYCVGMICATLFMLYHVWARFRSENQLAHQAAHDPLTGLAHRGTFEWRLRNLAGQQHVVVLGTIDRFDRFDRVIGGLGHAVGDRLMLEFADRIKRVVERDGGEVFRLDGANVAILYRARADNPYFHEALTNLQEHMRRPFEFGQHEIFSSMSLGGAEYPRDGAKPSELLQNANAALQAARDAGGDCYISYSNDLNMRAQERLTLEAQLRHAIERNELELHYQPQQRLSDNELVGFEALVRWRRNGELIPPGEFIPLAEESGLIVPIGDWVLAEACRQAKVWSIESSQKFVIAVNISPRQFHHPSFLRRVTKALNESMIDPTFIELEITEGIVMRDVERTIELLKDLRARGLALSIDDFGTGYSSLAYLKRFSLDKLKIDQSFVRHLRPETEDAAIVQAVINLGHHLGLSVIAEGVETAAQRDLLQRWGCDQIQGYLYGRPLPADKATQFMFDHLMAPAEAYAAPAGFQS